MEHRISLLFYLFFEFDKGSLRFKEERDFSFPSINFINVEIEERKKVLIYCCI